MHMGTGAQIHKDIQDSRGEVLCLQECTWELAQAMREFRGAMDGPRGSGGCSYPYVERPEENLDRSFLVVHSLDANCRLAVCVRQSHFEGIKMLINR